MTFWAGTRYENGVHLLEFSNPPENIMPIRGMAELARCLDDLADDLDLKVLVLTGTDDVFIAHADIEDLAKVGRREDVGADPASWYAASMALQTFPTPTIAAVNGRAWGGGLELAMCADIRFAGGAATFGQPELTIGIIPGGGGTQRLPRLVGRGKAAELIFEGRIIDSDEAGQIGLVQRVYEDADLLPETISFADRIAAHSSEVLRAAKTAILGSEVPLAEGLALEGRLFTRLLPNVQDELSEALGRERPFG